MLTLATAGAAAASDGGWSDFKPAARRDSFVVDGARDVPPIVESATNDDPSDPPPPGSPALRRAGPGVSALSGRILQTDGAPLAGVELRLGVRRAWSDADGLFLIEGAQPGYGVMIIDGRKGQAAGAPEAVDHGIFETRVKVEAGRTTQLPWVSWLPIIDHAHDIALPDVLTEDMTAKTPLVPGLEFKLPKGAVLTGLDGEHVHSLGLTKIPEGRTAYPMARHLSFPFYATIQPGGTTIAGAHGEWLGGQIVYPNATGLLPKARIGLWRYDPDSDAGWAAYGAGVVSADGARIEPEDDARVYALTGLGTPQNIWSPPLVGPACGCHKGPDGGVADPIDEGSGLFVLDRIDLTVPDVMPIEIRRVYRPADYNFRHFGVGMNLGYDLYFYNSVTHYSPGNLYLPDGSAVVFAASPTTAGFLAESWTAVTPGPYYDSTVYFDSTINGWRMTKPDGTQYLFQDGEFFPLTQIIDRHGNTITIARDGNGNATQITSPNGRHLYIALAGGSGGINAIDHVSDDAGRTVRYAYDASDRMTTFTDADGKVTTYGWDASNRMATLSYPNGGIYLTNTYDSNDRTIKQAQANGGIWNLSYTLNANGQETALSVTDPIGGVENIAFDANLHVVGDVKAAGTALQVTTTKTYDPVTQLLTSIVDPLGRTTSFARDGVGSITGVTQLAGTAKAATTTYAYGVFEQLAAVTDPLGHKTSYALNAAGDVTSVTDPLLNISPFTVDGEGRTLTAKDPLGNLMTYAYQGAALASVVDPLSRKTTFATDAVGRVIRTLDPLGDGPRATYDPANGVATTIDANGLTTGYGYSPTGKLASVKDARGGTISYAYDSFDLLATYTDAKGAVARIVSRDGLGDVLSSTDRKGQTTASTPDVLARLSTATYADGSSVSNIWDSGDRLTKVVDSVGGTVIRAYDGLDNLTSETSPQGAVIKTYDAASRLTSLQAPGQTLEVYGYDVDDRLTGITWGATSVVYAYDNASRLKSASLPTGIVATYSYDAASELTGITYVNGTTTLGTLTYGYDLAGRVAARGGTLFQSIPPAPVASAAYDAANRLTSRNVAGVTQTPTWDANGSLTSDGLNPFAWDARNRMTQIGSSGSSASFVYDAFGRRIKATRSGTATSYLYSGDNVVQEQKGGAISAQLLIGLGTDERVTRAGETYLTDLLGSTVALASGSAVQTHYGYDPYGVSQATGSATTNTFQYTGRENDGTAAGLMFYRARYYSPSWGRFVSEDPIGVAGGTNLYGYVGQQPEFRRDPDGHGWRHTCYLLLCLFNWDKSGDESPEWSPETPELECPYLVPKRNRFHWIS